MQLLHWIRPHAIPKNTHVHSLKHTHRQDLCEPPVYHHRSGATVEVLWSESYNIPPNSSLSASLLSHVLLTLAFPSFLTKAARPALSPPPPSPCQVRLAWLWTPRRHILLNTLLVDAGSLHNAWRWAHALEMWALVRGAGGGGGWRKNIKKMRRGWRVFFSLFWWTAWKSLLFSTCGISSCPLQKRKKKIHECSHRFSLKDKSSVSALLLGVSDCCALTCFLLSAGVSDIVFFFFLRYSWNQCEVFDHQELKVWQLAVLSTSLPHPNCCFILLWHFSPA